MQPVLSLPQGHKGMHKEHKDKKTKGSKNSLVGCIFVIEDACL